MSVGNTIIPDAFLRWEIPFIIDSVLYFTELKPKGKGIRENRRDFAVRSSPPFIPSSSPSSRRSVALCHVCYGSLCSLILAMCSYLLIECLFSMSTTIMSSSYPRNNFIETDAMFLEFEDDLDNIAGGSSFVGDNTEYIEVVKGDLQRLFVLDFNDQAMNRFVEHQMLTTFKEFRADCHRHFKKYSNTEEARANPPNALEQSRTNKAARQRHLTIIVAGPSRFYNDSTSSLREKGSRSIVWSCFEKHTFELGRSCRRLPRMRMHSRCRAVRRHKVRREGGIPDTTVADACDGIERGIPHRSLIAMEKSDIARPISTILDGSNYITWAHQMRSLLIGRKLWRIVIGDITKPIKPTPSVKNTDKNNTEHNDANTSDIVVHETTVEDIKYIERLEDWDNKNHQIIT
ncbi:CACTA en-spm transposon protein [Cucumis melo var. makuwa]|uniref:CACTA en-spm transposon protein n=1 Tax=Cucumis melo var. makuwa TaxID=1194695 RepID=A0A5A7UU01_CUCMM|nr:CACTA en-spm transposon protein [Cucumis melo var. makuwa]